MYSPKKSSDGPATPPNADVFGWLEDHTRFPEAHWRGALRVERGNLGLPSNTALRPQGFSMGTHATSRFFQPVDGDYVHPSQHPEVPDDIQGIIKDPSDALHLMVPIESAPPVYGNGSVPTMNRRKAELLAHFSGLERKTGQWNYRSNETQNARAFKPV
jgi:hypothetical protein